jgi:hypothetical protein
MKAVGLLLFAAVIAISPEAKAATAIGTVTRIEGPCEGVVEGGHRELATGFPVHLDEMISTGAGARLELTFDDGTMLTVGERARLMLDEFVYRPGGESRFRTTVTGAFRYVSGKFASGAVRDAAVTTPFATIGVRGTDFWGGPIDGDFGVILFEGAISVSTAGGTVLLQRPGSGVAVGSGAQPGPVTTWPQDKVNRAAATVAFR